MNITIPRTINILSTASDIGDPEVFSSFKDNNKHALVIDMFAVPLRLCVFMPFHAYKQRQRTRAFEITSLNYTIYILF